MPPVNIGRYSTDLPYPTTSPKNSAIGIYICIEYGVFVEYRLRRYLDGLGRKEISAKNWVRRLFCQAYIYTIYLE